MTTQPENAAAMAVRNDQQLAQMPHPSQMIESVIKSGVTQENVAVIEKLIELQERMEQRNAERQFTSAFVALQSDLPVIVASTVIQNRGKYERFEDLMRVVGPLLIKHQFTVSFSMDFREGRVLETCHLKHVSGHSQSNSFAVRTGKADTETQADCKAATTAKRNALCNALNIVIRQDVFTEENDASIEGGAITEQEADDLRRRVKATNSDEAAFLELAGVGFFEDIPRGKFEVLDQMLARKEAKQRR